MPHDRTYPGGDRQYMALAQDRWAARGLDTSQKVAVFWLTEADTITLVGYYSTVGAANTAAASNAKDNGAKPRVEINWWHSDISHLSSGPVQHIDAREDLPSWIDEDVAA